MNQKPNENHRTPCSVESFESETKRTPQDSLQFRIFWIRNQRTTTGILEFSHDILQFRSLWIRNHMQTIGIVALSNPLNQAQKDNRMNCLVSMESLQFWILWIRNQMETIGSLAVSNPRNQKPKENHRNSVSFESSESEAKGKLLESLQFQIFWIRNQRKTIRILAVRFCGISNQRATTGILVVPKEFLQLRILWIRSQRKTMGVLQLRILWIRNQRKTKGILAVSNPRNPKPRRKPLEFLQILESSVSFESFESEVKGEPLKIVQFRIIWISNQRATTGMLAVSTLMNQKPKENLKNLCSFESSESETNGTFRNSCRCESSESEPRGKPQEFLQFQNLWIRNRRATGKPAVSNPLFQKPKRETCGILAVSHPLNPKPKSKPQEFLQLQILRIRSQKQNRRNSCSFESCETEAEGTREELLQFRTLWTRNLSKTVGLLPLTNPMSHKPHENPMIFSSFESYDL